MSEREEQFADLYHRYYRRLVQFFVRAFRVSQDDATDLAQDTFIRYFRALDEYRGDAEWAFLEKIARNVGYNRIRAMSTAKRTASHESLDTTLADVEAATTPLMGDDPLSPENRIVEEERRQHLKNAIARLPEGMRQCLVLLLHGYSYEQIAAALRISQDAVKSRIRDAKRRLRDVLGDVAI